MMIMLKRVAVPAMLLGGGLSTSCPFLDSSVEKAGSGLPSWHPPVGFRATRPQAERFVERFEEIDFNAVKADLMAAFEDSKEWWPADFGNYGPLIIRLAWHAGGSYRVSDGRGGADGGRLRFDPERSWGDNTNLDKAIKLLRQIKDSYGPGLSWGDLIVLAGTTAIEMMGGPVIGFCGGRIDDSDGFWSKELGPTPEQQALMPCDIEGECEFPLAPDAVGLIYVNAQGPHGVPDPALSAKNVRSTFSRMGFNDRETVAIVGGGHAFGKTHGACGEGAGPNPQEQPLNPWPGKCGSGKGEDTFTSGFEGSWTYNPTEWDNEYFQLLLENEWETYQNHNNIQWRIKDGSDDVMMLTADLAFVNDDAYQPIVEEFASDLSALDEAFGEAWYKLMTRDMGPASRCLGDSVPEPRPFQGPLPEATRGSFNEKAVRKALQPLVKSQRDGLIRLAWACASTFRVTDYHGGCNGARVRLEPQRSWEQNRGLDVVYALLDPIFDKHDISYADLIVLAGTMAVEEETGRDLPFCRGRVDAIEDGGISENLAPIINLGDGEATMAQMRDEFLRHGLTASESVAVIGALHSMGCATWCLTDWMEDSQFVGRMLPGIDYTYFEMLLLEESFERFEDADQTYFMGELQTKYLNIDVMVATDPELRAIAEEFAKDVDLFFDELSAAWTKMMIADRFDGPAGNVCVGEPMGSVETCGTKGKVQRAKGKKLIGETDTACECKTLCATGGNKAFVWREGRGECVCVKSFKKILAQDQLTTIVGHIDGVGSF